MYRIITEHTNVDGIKSLLRDEKMDFTLHEATGSWQGVEERSLVIELDALWDDSEVTRVAKKIRSLNNQEAVLIQNIPTEGVFV